MAQVGINFDAYETGEVGTATDGEITSQAIGPPDWSQSIVDLGGGDLAFQIERGASGGTTALNVAVLNAIATTGDIDVVCAMTLGNSWTAGQFAGAALAASNNWAYAIREADGAGFRLGLVDATPTNNTTLGSSYAMSNPSAGTVIWTRVRRVGTTIMGKIWTGAAEDEPGTWTWSTTNTTLTTVSPGMYGMHAGMKPFTYLWFGVGTAGDAAPMPGGGAVIDPGMTFGQQPGHFGPDRGFGFDY